MNIQVVALFVALISLLTACSPSEPSLSNPRMALDAAGTKATTAYTETDVFYVVTDLSNAPNGTVVKAVWSGLNAGGGAEVINESSQTIGESSFMGPISFQLDTETRWPAGEYQVELFLNDAHVETLSFTVE
jgi:hypothetical protein